MAIRIVIIEDTIDGLHRERAVSLEELAYLLQNTPLYDTANTWTQTQTFSNIVDEGLSVNTVVIANAQKQLASSSVTSSELAFVTGVTSAIQTQLDAKLDTLASAGQTLSFSEGNVDINLAHANSWTATQTFSNTVVTQPATTSGTTTPAAAVIVTGAAHNTILGGVEAVDINWNLARIVTFTQVAITTQRAVRIQAPTYAFFGGVATITNAATVAISGAPIVGNNAAITNRYALWIESGVARFDGGLNLGSNQAVTNSGTLTFSNTVSFASSCVIQGTLTYNNAGTQAVILIQPTANTNLTQAVFQVRAFGGSTNLMSIRRNGYVSTMLNAAPADAELSANEAIYWFDSSNGAGKFMVKAKTADGTVVTGALNLT